MNDLPPHWSESLPNTICPASREWVVLQPSPDIAWDRCKRPGWLAWAVAYSCQTTERLSAFVLALSALVREALETLASDEPMLARVLDATEAWARGETSAVATELACREAFFVAALSGMHVRYLALAAGHVGDVISLSRFRRAERADSIILYVVTALQLHQKDVSREDVQDRLCVSFRKLLPMPDLALLSGAT